MPVLATEYRGLHLIVKSPRRRFIELPASDDSYAAPLRQPTCSRGVSALSLAARRANLRLLVLLLHGKSNLLVNANTEANCRALGIDVLMHNTVCGRGSSIDDAYFDGSFIFILAHAHTDGREVTQLA